MREPKLKPCPFCGERGYMDELIEPHTHSIATFMPDVNYYRQFICCSRCSAGLCGDEKETAEQAIQSAVDKWNSRKETT